MSNNSTEARENFTDDDKYRIITGDSGINQVIRDTDNPDVPWDVIDIIDTVHDHCGIDIDTDNTDLMGKLLTYFNTPQTL